jgi:predicted HTH domain antitoxin
MDTLTIDEVGSQLQRLLADIARGEPAMVTKDGLPLFMAVPMGTGLEAPAVRLELAVRLFERGQISLGVAARIAGLSSSEMVDEFGKRAIPVVRYDQEDFREEMEYVRTLTRRG